MNVREKARRSDALHYDYISRRDLCNMIANLESDLEDSKAKNAKTFEVGKRWMAKAARFESENVKLRELIANVRDALRADKAGMFHKLILASMEDDMRELGIEVDK